MTLIRSFQQQDKFFFFLFRIVWNIFLKNDVIEDELNKLISGYWFNNQDFFIIDTLLTFHHRLVDDLFTATNKKIANITNIV